MPKLIMLVGPPGSGKSTKALEFTNPNGLNEFDNRVFDYINQDTQGKDHLKLFTDFIAMGTDILIDRMNFNKIQRDRYLVPAKAAGYSTEIIVLHENYETCLQRCVNRIGNHPTIATEQDAKSALNTFFSKYERVQDDEADVVTRMWSEGAKDTAIWVDVDNTLSDATHREHFLQNGKKNWKGFFDAMGDDPINQWCLDLISGMINNYQVLICSARPDNYRPQTIKWLDKNNVPFNKLIMRPRNDSRRDDIVKEIMYEFEVKTKYNLLFSVDDRKQVIDRIRSHGVTVLDCAGEKGHF